MPSFYFLKQKWYFLSTFLRILLYHSILYILTRKVCVEESYSKITNTHRKETELERNAVVEDWGENVVLVAGSFIGISGEMVCLPNTCT